MMVLELLFTACFALSGELPQSNGTIGGIVVNASDRESPVAGAEVVLRIKLDGQFVPAATTTADAEGKFRFERLLAGRNFHYLPGANRDDVHYPGPHVRLTARQPHVDVKLAVCDSVTQPSPLVARRHEIVIIPKAGALHVTESLLVANPSTTCYVGRADGEGTEPVTLRLSIPPDFERITFHKEFFGRRFSLANGKLLTGIPWTPGERELKFTYVLPNTRKYRLWVRPLDLPCSHVRVCVRTSKPDEIACNLEPGPVQRQGDVSEVSFESEGRNLPAGHVVRVELGDLPVSWMDYVRWVAPVVLMGLISGASLVMIKRGRKREASARRP